MSRGTAGPRSTSVSVKREIMPTIRSMSTVKAPSILLPEADRLLMTPILTTSPPRAPPGMTSEKKYPCMVRERASPKGSSTWSIRASLRQRHEQVSMWEP